MIIGIPREVKGDEKRVSILPSGVESFISAGHEVIIEQNAGLANGFSDEDYIVSGANIVPLAIDVYNKADLIFKVKEIVNEEYDYIREGQILLGYYQTQDRPELTRLLLDKKVVVYSYERIRDKMGEYPLLSPMSAIAGKVSVILGAYYLFNTQGGDGILIGGFPGIEPAKITILGAGNSGLGALRYAYGLGADITLLDRNIHKLKKVKESFQGVKTLLVNESNIKKVLSETDMLINSIRHKSGPYIINRNMLKSMKPNSLIVNADGMPHGAIETAKETTHEDPCYIVDGIRHISISNYPSAVTKTATMALANATTPYVLNIANKGWIRATKENDALQNGLTIANGYLTFEHAAKLHNLKYTSVDDVINILDR